jgi:hypothetical protein
VWRCNGSHIKIRTTEEARRGPLAWPGNLNQIEPIRLSDHWVGGGGRRGGSSHTSSTKQAPTVNRADKRD